MEITEDVLVAERERLRTAGERPKVRRRRPAPEEVLAEAAELPVIQIQRPLDDEEDPDLPAIDLAEDDFPAPSPQPAVVVDIPPAAMLRDLVAPLMASTSNLLNQLLRLRLCEQDPNYQPYLPPELWVRVAEAQRKAADLYEAQGKILWLLRPR